LTSRRAIAAVVLGAAVLAVMALLVQLWRTPPADVRPEIRNVVIIMTDDQDVDSLPVMRKLMAFPEGSWINFTSAITNHSICCPARATVLTGQYSHVTGVTSNALGAELDDTNTLAVWLDRAGYQTGLVGKYLNGYPWSRGDGYVPPGWDSFNVTGARTVDGRAGLAVSFINEAAAPFLLYLAFNEPHEPADPPARYASAEVPVPPDRPNFDEADVSDKPSWVRRLPPIPQATMDQWHAERLASQRSLLAVDDAVQAVIDALLAKGELDNTVVIFLADNGFSWGSHRHYRKLCVYDECGMVPLLMRVPGLAANRVEPRLVSNVDLVATITELVGVEPGLPQDGRSLVPLITNPDAPWTEEALLEVHTGRSRSFDGIRTGEWTYAEYANGDLELYDLTTDPDQLDNLAGDPALADIREVLANRIRSLRGS
jgi:arylsulfatase A-like enzyme